MKFTDYTPEELVGLNVLWTFKGGRCLTKIKSATKEGFYIAPVPFGTHTIFNVENGRATDGDGRCRLLTEARAKNISIEIKKNNDEWIARNKKFAKFNDYENS